MSDSLLYDVAIIGAGPAGSAAGTQLAKAGLRVVMLEKEKFPRFAIGESLLPHGNNLLRELGVWPKLEEAGFLRKYGAEFCTGDKSRLRRFWFAQNLGSSCEYSYQVDRASFDQLLLNHAREQGCVVHEECRVTSIKEPDQECMSILCSKPDRDFEITCRWVVDASGRSGFAGTRLGLRRKNTQQTKRVAIYGHFEGVFRNSGKAEGHITIARLAGGWFWIIPLAGNRASVGLVLPAEKIRSGSTSGERDLETIFREVVDATPEVRDRMSRATPLMPLRATGDYSWKYSSFATRRILLTGDAAGFVDPIFSSGVMLALKSGVRAATLIARAEKSKRALHVWERITYTHSMSGWMNQYSRLIGEFYDRAGFEVFMNPAPFLQIPRSIARIVGGNAQPGLIDQLRLLIFHAICRLQSILPIAPSISSLR